MEPPASFKRNLLEGLDPGALFGMGSESRTPGVSPSWHPPQVAELASSFEGYEILELLGRGAMGAVYLARQSSLDRLVAIKVLPSEACAEEAYVQRFHREARTLAKLNHPGIVDIYDFGTTSHGLLYLVMEYVEGQSLAAWLGGKFLEPKRAVEILIALCEALDYAHSRGVIHRDIKPTNVLLDVSGRVKVADFGLAKLSVSKSEELSLLNTHPGAMLGTPGYAAPEQMKARARVDARADLYSAGVLLYEMLTGDLPRGVFEPPSLKRGTPVALDEVILRALQENPGMRFASASDFRKALLPLLALPTPNRHRKRGVAWMLVAGLLIAGSAFLFWRFQPNAQTAPVASPAPVGPGQSEAPPSQDLVMTPEVHPVLPEVSQESVRESTFQNRQYLLVEKPATWENAQSIAMARGGSLASVSNAEVNDWLTENFAAGTAGGIFLGGHCGVPGGEWEWVDGAPWSYQAWQGAAPIFGALVLTSDGKWTATSFQEARPFVIVFSKKMENSSSHLSPPRQ